MIGTVVVGLVVSGLTAFPLLLELNVLAARLDLSTELGWWIHYVRDGLAATYASYPFVAYGTDWLAFAHLVIAMFFLLPWKDPVRYEAVLWVGVAASVLVLPFASVWGAIREIPLGWRAIDASFGVLCLIPLGLAIRWTKRLRMGELKGGFPVMKSSSESVPKMPIS
ncbi:hypothetical protein HAHE_09780 [Haloferula helveola]|uniref:Uncharacterized protein n=2 Tax=Haloferula helveola TaxID=490095 RepID=A0ABM7RJ76_9BACT|nr:hypothetical protein HAHE_09780 [Haloferula helveola]